MVMQRLTTSSPRSILIWQDSSVRQKSCDPGRFPIAAAEYIVSSQLGMKSPEASDIFQELLRA